jgi:RHS repeat-associated protein
MITSIHLNHDMPARRSEIDHESPDGHLAFEGRAERPLATQLDSDAEERDGRIVQYASMGSQRIARLDGLDGEAPAAAAPTGGAGGATAARGAAAAISRSLAALGSSVYWLAIVFGGFLMTLLASLRRRREIGLMPRLAAWATCAVALSLLVLPSCSCETGKHAASRDPRDGSQEITAVPPRAKFYLADWQNSPVAVTDAKGSITSATSYHPYGSVRNAAGQKADPWSFVGNEKDDGTGLGDFHARPYRAELGMFLGPDPVGVFGAEKTVGDSSRLFAYAYAGGNPVNAADPDGLTFWDYVRGIADEGAAQAKVAVSAVAGEVRASVQAASEGRVLEGYGRASYLYMSTVGTVGMYQGARGLAKGVASFGDDFAHAACSDGTDYQAGHAAAKPVSTAMSAVAAALGAYRGVRAFGTGGWARGAGGRTEIVQRAMSRAELDATRQTGLLRGGREGPHFVSDAVNSSATRAQIRLALPVRPEVRATLEVPAGRFSAPTRVEPLEVSPGRVLPGGGTERTATGQVPTRVLGVDSL